MDSAARDSSPPAPNRRGFAFSAAWALLVSVALVPVLVQLMLVAPLPVVRARAAVAHAWFQMDNEEGALLFQALELRAGRSIYRPLTDYPFVAGTYPPVYPMLAGLFADPSAPDFRAGRVISLAACLGAAMMLLVTVAFRTRNLVTAALAAALFLATFEVHSWLPYYRVDMLALFFTVLGVGSMALSPRERAARRVSVALFALAFFTKQTHVAGPLAVGVWMLANDRRGGLRWCAMMTAAVAVPFAVLTAATRGQFAIHTVWYNMNTWRPGDVAVWARHVWRFYPWLVAAGVAALAAGAVLARIRPAANPVSESGTGVPPVKPELVQEAPDTPTTQSVFNGTGESQVSGSPPRPAHASAGHAPIPELYLLFSLLNFVAIGKAGSAENYLLEPLAAFALVVGDMLGRLTRAQFVPGLRVPARLGALVLTGLMLGHGIHVSRLAPILFSRPMPSAPDLEAASRVAREVIAARGDTWTELGIFNLLAGRPIHLQPFIMSELARQKKWDQARFLGDLERRRFALIVTNFDAATGDATDVYTPEMLRMIRLHYREAERIESGRTWRYYLYRPSRPPASDRSLVNMDASPPGTGPRNQGLPAAVAGGRPTGPRNAAL